MKGFFLRGMVVVVVVWGEWLLFAW